MSKPRLRRQLPMKVSVNNMRVLYYIALYCDMLYSILFCCVLIGSPERSSQRAIELPPPSALSLALASASTNVKVLR